MTQLGWRVVKQTKQTNKPYFMCVNSKGSGETAWMRKLAWASLIAYMISALILWAGLNVKTSTNVITHLKCYNDFNTNVKTIIDSCNANCENFLNGFYGLSRLFHSFELSRSLDGA